MRKRYSVTESKRERGKAKFSLLEKSSVWKKEKLLTYYLENEREHRHKHINPHICTYNERLRFQMRISIREKAFNGLKCGGKKLQIMLHKYKIHS